MPVVSKSFNIAAGGRVDNVFEGSIYRTMKRPGVVTIYAVQDGSFGDITSTVTAGVAIVVNSDAVKESSAAGKGPNSPDDLFCNFSAEMLDDLGMSLVNSSAGALDVRVRAEIN